MTKNFRWFSFMATAATYFLIFVGGLVRVSGAGLGCPDWPKCFGRWIPPLSTSQLPSDIDPSVFNFALAWIEYINRLIGVGVGLLIAIVAILAIKNFRKELKILVPAIVAALMVAFQGWLGGQVVNSELAPNLISVHMVLAAIIANLMVYVSLQSYYLDNPVPSGARYPRATRLWLGLLWLMVLIQMVLGTRIREALETIAGRLPLASEMEWLAEVGSMGLVHTVLGVLVALSVLAVGFTVLRKQVAASALVWQNGWTMIGLVVIQFALGVILYTVGIPAVIQVMHMWVASILLGVVLLTYGALAHEGVNK